MLHIRTSLLCLEMLITSPTNHERLEGHSKLPAKHLRPHSSQVAPDDTRGVCSSDGIILRTWIQRKMHHISVSSIAPGLQSHANS
jgi:hypothetical protein